MKFTGRVLWTMVATTVLVSAFFSGSVKGQQSSLPRKSTHMEIGKPAVVCSATAAHGRWAEKYPFDPDSYGKVRGYSPVTSAEPKIVLYTRSLDKDFFRLASAVDALIAGNKGLEWSLVQVIDEKGAQYGGYSTAELRRRIETIHQLADQNKIAHLSFVISASNASSFPRQLGLADDKNLLIAHLAGEDRPNSHAVVKWIERLNTAQLSEKSIQTIVAALEKSIAEK